ncbi:MAG: hypothetical protein F9K40_15835, partial [Kofleriaceae bacterium]
MQRGKKLATIVIGAAVVIGIAGGVGVTPFIAWLHDADATGLDGVTFFHFFTPGRQLPEAV